MPLAEAAAAHHDAGAGFRAGGHLGQQSGLDLSEEDVISLALSGLYILALLIVQHPDLQQSQ